MKQDERRFRSAVAMSEVDMKIETEEVGTKQPSTSSSGKGRPSHRRSWPSLGDPEQRSKVIKISHIPYGFFEQELLKYFRQFGRVRRVRVARSPKTGNFKGWAFVSFTDVDVAQVAAETMHGYLMFEKRLICKVLKNKEVPNCMRSGKCLKRPPLRGARAKKHARLAGKHKSEFRDAANKKRFLRQLKKKEEQLAAMGFNYSLNIDSIERHPVEKEEPKEEVYEDVGENTSKGSEPTVEAAELPSAKKKKKKKKKKKHAASRKDTKTVIE
ncbi:putative RNA-binding protein [Toxocara canis]|uniref:Putative RNA-binding protein n=1 Tax=Toxocara canis TaxID=6265 RepID=A0A0B2V7N7_TOXCA|nr:putative RNA-binding protein [Toxocara canis]